MSESWHGITLAEVRHAVYKNIINNLRTVNRLIDGYNDTDYEFETWKNGAVIVTNNFLNWEFVAPNDFNLNPGATVENLFQNMETAVINRPVAAWDDFAVFIDSYKDTINFFLQEGTAAVIRDSDGTPYAGTVHQIGSFNRFADCVAWMKSWMGGEILAENSSVVYDSDSVIKFSLTSANTTISCTFKL